MQENIFRYYVGPRIYAENVNFCRSASCNYCNFANYTALLESYKLQNSPTNWMGFLKNKEWRLLPFPTLHTLQMWSEFDPESCSCSRTDGKSARRSLLIRYWIQAKDSIFQQVLSISSTNCSRSRFTQRQCNSYKLYFHWAFASYHDEDTLAENSNTESTFAATSDGVGISAHPSPQPITFILLKCFGSCEREYEGPE